MANPGMPVCKSPSGQKTDSDCKIVELISLKPCHPTEIQHVLNMFCIYNKFTVTKKLSYDRKMRKILKQTCFPIPLLIPNAISFHHWHDLAWLHPHDWHVCPKWHDTHCMNSGHQIIVVQSVSKLDLTPSNQKQKTWSWLDHQSLLDDPLTCSSSSPSTTSSSSSSESGFVTWMQKRPLMQTQTWPSPHIMFQWMLIFLWCGTKMSTVYFDRKNSETKKCSSAFNYQSSNDPPFLISIDGRNDSPNSSHKLEHTARNDSPPPMHKLTGQLNLCLCNEQLMIIKHSNHDLTWPFKTLTWHYKIEFSEDLP